MAPEVVLTLGNFSSRLLLGTKDGITTLRGRSYPVGLGGRTVTVVPTLHPAAVLRGGKVPMGQVRWWATWARARPRSRRGSARDWAWRTR